MITLSVLDDEGTQHVRTIDTQMLRHWVSVARNEIESCVAELHARHDAASTPMTGFAEIVHVNLTRQLLDLDYLVETLEITDGELFFTKR